MKMMIILVQSMTREVRGLLQAANGAEEQTEVMGGEKDAALVEEQVLPYVRNLAEAQVAAPAGEERPEPTWDVGAARRTLPLIAAPLGGPGGEVSP